MDTWRAMYEKMLDILIPLSPEEEEALHIAPEKVTEKMHPQTHTLNGCVVITLFSYDDPLIKQLIWLCKYKRNRHATTILAQTLAEFLLEELGDRYMFEAKVKPLLVPIPLSKKRKKERGFNQMDLLARKMHDYNNTLFDDGIGLLTKTRHTKTQTGLSKTGRVANVKNAFTVPHPDNIKGRAVVLIDDVVTTGSTLAEARKTLTQAKAQSVTCIALAH